MWRIQYFPDLGDERGHEPAALFEIPALRIKDLLELLNHKGGIAPLSENG